MWSQLKVLMYTQLILIFLWWTLTTAIKCGPKSWRESFHLPKMKNKQTTKNKIKIIYQKLSVTDPKFRRENLVLLHLVLTFPSFPSLSPKKRRKDFWQGMRNYSSLHVLQLAYVFNQHTSSSICQTNPGQQGWAEKLLWAIPCQRARPTAHSPTPSQGCVRTNTCAWDNSPGVTQSLHPFWMGGLISVVLLKSKIKLNSCIVINPATIKLAQYLIPSA